MTNETRRWIYLQGADLAHVVAEAGRLYEGGATGREIRATLGLTEMQMRRVARIAGLDLLARHRESTRLAPDEIQHGTPSAWSYHGCRCDVCVEARAVYKKREREAERARYAADPDAPGWPPHGTTRRATLGCTCDTCITAQTSETRARQAETVATARNTGKAWTGPELEIVADRSRKIRDIAVMLGRTYASVSNARRALDDPRNGRHAAYTELLGQHGRDLFPGSRDET